MDTKALSDSQLVLHRQFALPVLAGKVQAVLAKKGAWTQEELGERTIQVFYDAFSPCTCEKHSQIVWSGRLAGEQIARGRQLLLSAASVHM